LLLPRVTDDFFVTVVPGPVVAPAPGADEGGDGSASLLAAAGLALGLVSWRGAARQEEALRRRPAIR
jgi:hypothetical protein